MSPLLTIIITIKYIHYLCCLDQLIRFIIKFTQKKNYQELDKACLSPTLTEMATYYFDGQVNFDFDDDDDGDGYRPLC